MKNKAVGLLKQIISVITAMAKAKTLALKSKTRAIKTRLIIFSLLRNRKILTSSISDKLQALMMRSHDHDKKGDDKENEYDDQEDESSKCNNSNAAGVLLLQKQESVPNPTHTATAVVDDDDDEDEADNIIYEINNNNNNYPDLTHSLFDGDGDGDDDDDMDPEMDGGAGSVIELVKNSKEDQGEEFRLEDEIDQVVDLFIKRFHRQMKFQKQLSFKRYQEMLHRSTA